MEHKLKSNVILCIGDFESQFHNEAFRSIVKMYRQLFRRHHSKIEEKVIYNFPLAMEESMLDADRNIKKLEKNQEDLWEFKFVDLDYNPEILFPYVISDNPVGFEKRILKALFDYNVIGIISYSFTFQCNSMLKIIKYFDIPVLITLATSVDYSEIIRIKGLNFMNLLRLVPSNESQAEVLRAAIESNALNSTEDYYKINILSKPQNNIYVNDLTNLVYNLFDDKLIIEHHDNEVNILENNPQAILVISHPSEFDFNSFYEKYKVESEKITWYFTDSYYPTLDRATSNVMPTPKIWMSAPVSNIETNTGDAYNAIYEVWKYFKLNNLKFDSHNFVTYLREFLQNDIRFGLRYLFRANINVMGGFSLRQMKVRI